jgi:hypothetical protein
MQSDHCFHGVDPLRNSVAMKRRRGRLQKGLIGPGKPGVGRQDDRHPGMDRATTLLGVVVESESALRPREKPENGGQEAAAEVSGIGVAA